MIKICEGAAPCSDRAQVISRHAANRLRQIDRRTVGDAPGALALRRRRTVNPSGGDHWLCAAQRGSEGMGNHYGDLCELYPWLPSPACGPGWHGLPALLSESLARLLPPELLATLVIEIEEEQGRLRIGVRRTGRFDAQIAALNRQAEEASENPARSAEPWAAAPSGAAGGRRSARSTSSTGCGCKPRYAVVMADHPPSPPVRVNRAPVLTLWAAVVAERLGYPPETALSLASAVAGTAARAKARRLGIQEEREAARPEPGESDRRPVKRNAVRLLGREVLVTRGEGGVLLAAEVDGRPASPDGIRNYVGRAFGARLGEVRQAMEDLAASLDPQELNRIGFRLYEHFRPDVPEGVRGWGAKGELRLQRIRDAAGR